MQTKEKRNTHESKPETDKPEFPGNNEICNSSYASRITFYVPNTSKLQDLGYIINTHLFRELQT